VGTRTVRVVVGEFQKGSNSPRIIGAGESETKGMRHGYVIDSESAGSSIKEAVQKAERSSGTNISRAFVSVSGTSLRGELGSGTVIVSKADGEVTSLDINKAIQESEDSLSLNNKKIIQSFPLSFKLDGKEVFGRLEGMRGTKLEVKSMFFTYSIQHLEDLVETLAEADIEATDVVPAPMALEKIALSDKQKIVGVALVDIGSETVSLCVFEDGLPIAMNTFSIGSGDITNDIALGFKISLERAEALKLGGELDDGFSKKKLDEIIEARLSDIFELIENHLKKIKRSELLPAGIVFVGGGANIAGIEELSKSILKLPSSIGSTEIFGTTKTKLRDPGWFTALGLIISGTSGGGYFEGSFGTALKDLKKTLKSSLNQLMP
jgi:cell division protein FtsA